MDVEHQQGIRGYYLAQERGVPIVIMEPNKGGALANLPADIESIFRAYDPDASMASWAFRWIASLSNVKVVLSGMTTMAQVVDNLSVFHAFKPLNHRESILVEEAAKAIRAKTKNGCTGCNYCMPGPFGVDIPKTSKYGIPMQCMKTRNKPQMVFNRWIEAMLLLLSVKNAVPVKISVRSICRSERI